MFSNQVVPLRAEPAKKIAVEGVGLPFIEKRRRSPSIDIIVKQVRKYMSSLIGFEIDLIILRKAYSEVGIFIRVAFTYDQQYRWSS